MTTNKALEWLVLRHVEHEHIGILNEVLGKFGIQYRYVDVFRNDAVPKNADGCDGLIIMGGPMGVYESDRYPFLAEEQRLIRDAVNAGLPVLGICLGSQLIASALGGKVYAGPRKEIGWHPVELTTSEDTLTSGLPSPFMGFHWHGDTFDLPSDAVRLFRSDLYENQGFRYGKNVLALQFHCEVNAAMIHEWLEDGGCQAELAPLTDTTAEMIRKQTAQWAATLEQFGEKLFSRFLELTCANAATDRR